MASEYVAGVVAGSANILSGYPFDTVKVRLQSVEGSRYRGPIQCARSILRQEGVAGFFRGASSPVIGGALETGLNYLLYEQAHAAVRRWRNSDNDQLRDVFIAGSIAGVGISFVLTPVELVKCRMQTDIKQAYSSTWKCFKAILYEDGPRGLMRGLAATQVREIIGNGLFFWSYAFVKSCLSPRDAEKSHETSRMRELGVAVMSGGLAGMAYWSTVLPIDVVKTNIQIHRGDYEALTTAIRIVWNQRGIRGFYAGLSTTLVRAFPANACQWVAWELAISTLKPQP